MPAEHQIRGLGPITISVPDLKPTDAVLTTLMNMRKVRDYPHPDERQAHRACLSRWARAAPAPSCTSRCSRTCGRRSRARAACITSRSARPTTEYDAWAERLNKLRIPNSGKVDRFWFRSLYFREPNGILFEIATDGPGFAADEPMDTLGEKLALPPFLEAQRARDRGGAEAGLAASLSAAR